MIRPLGDEIQLRRRKSYLTRRELARDIGVAEATIYGWETGRSKPRLRYVERIEHRLGFEPGELLRKLYFIEQS